MYAQQIINSLQSMRQKNRGLQSADFNRESLPGQLRDRGTLPLLQIGVLCLPSPLTALHSP